MEETTKAMDIIEAVIVDYVNGKIDYEALYVVQGW